MPSRRVDPIAAPAVFERRYTPRSPEQTLMRRVVREQLETFLSRSRCQDQSTPSFVEQELRAFLRCGVLAHGFLRLHCDDCGHDRLVAFSCKRRDSVRPVADDAWRTRRRTSWTAYSQK